jgi:hypothetical protein
MDRGQTRKNKIPPHMGPKKEGFKVLGFRIISRKEKLLSKYVPVTIASVAGKLITICALLVLSFPACER